MEDVESFRQRTRAFVRENLKPVGAVIASLRADRSDEEELAIAAREREVQRLLLDAALAGRCMPREYSGQWLTPTHQRVLHEDLHCSEYPSRLPAPTFTPCASLLLSFGHSAEPR